MKTIVNLIKVYSMNFMTVVLNLFIWRDKKVWLFGAWMGDKFSDNPRFLFQYLYENKDKYDIKKIVWVTRNKNVLEMLKQMGYESYLMNSIHGIFYHLKAGVHFACNNVSFSGYEYDINSYLSFGAKKIQLWHGVGIKACGKLTRKNPNNRTFGQWINDIFLSRHGQPGGWGESYFLATSKENARVAIDDYNVKKENIIISVYPRLLCCTRLLPNEKEVINRLREFKVKNKKIILYLPTFRKNDVDFTNPCDIEGFADFIMHNNIIWVQKEHSASNKSDNDLKKVNVMVLNKDFDVNVLYDEIDLLITDYSSASSDCIYKRVKTLEYCPDYNVYVSNDRGFVSDFSNYHVGEPVLEAKELFFEIIKVFNSGKDYYTKQEEVRAFLYDEQEKDYNKIIVDILNKIYE